LGQIPAWGSCSGHTAQQLVAWKWSATMKPVHGNSWKAIILDFCSLMVSQDTAYQESTGRENADSSACR